MGEVDYVLLLGLSDQVRRSFTVERGRVTKFLIQYESFIDGKWTPIIRYDTAHGFAHCDEIFPDGDVKKTDLNVRDWNEALTMAINDLNQNWEMYKRRYLRRMKKRS